MYPGLRSPLPSSDAQCVLKRLAQSVRMIEELLSFSYSKTTSYSSKRKQDVHESDLENVHGDIISLGFGKVPVGILKVRKSAAPTPQ